MNLEKLKPWNWFKHEDKADTVTHQLPVTRSQAAPAADPLMRLHHEVDRWFDELSSAFGSPAIAPGLAQGDRYGGALSSLNRPRIDVSGDDNSYEIRLDVPGMNESDLSIEVRDDVLLIRGEKQESSEDRDRHYYRVERSYGAFQRTLALPDDANADEIAAKLDKGVLRLEIPRRENLSQDARRIEISH